MFAPAYPHAQLQSFEPIQPAHPFLVHWPSLPSQHDVDALVPEPWPLVGDVTDPHPQYRLVFGNAALVPGSSRKPGQPTRTNHGEIESDTHPARQFPPSCRP
jgi:hypothetical protein